MPHSIEDHHPGVRAVRARGPRPAAAPLTLEAVRRLALELGADDAGAVSLGHPDLAGERPYVLRAFPKTRSLVALVARMHGEDVRSPARSLANLEFHRTGHALDGIARELAARLSELGHPSVNPSVAFPMEMDEFPARTFVVSHKRVAVAAQLGRMGLHRNVIHPRFGSFILLGTVLTEATVEGAAAPLDYDPCVSCKLCVAACPVGAIEPDGAFRFSACYDHNYREFMSGFGDFVEEIVESRDRHDFRERVSASETASMWQSLAYQPSYKAAYCVAVCPAGEDVLAPFLADRPGYLREVVEPLTGRAEPVYVVPGSDAETHVRKRFPHKRVRLVRSSLRPTSPQAFFRALPLTFQRGPARGWAATFHFDLRDPAVQATVRIDDGRLEVADGLRGAADLAVRADARTWLEVAGKRRNAILAVLVGRLRIAGDRALLDRFAACFPR